jgi:hypothetical protein
MCALFEEHQRQLGLRRVCSRKLRARRREQVRLSNRDGVAAQYRRDRAARIDAEALRQLGDRADCLEQDLLLALDHGRQCDQPMVRDREQVFAMLPYPRERGQHDLPQPIGLE